MSVQFSASISDSFLKEIPLDLGQNPAIMSKKRRREQVSTNAQTIEIFEDLANEDEEIRLKAAKALLAISSYEKIPPIDQLNTILRRLVRGLSSGRKAARLGFSVALTEFLVQLFGPGKGYLGDSFPNVSTIIGGLEEQTQISGNVSGQVSRPGHMEYSWRLMQVQEERDHYFGRLFGAEAIIKSSILFESEVDIDQWERILNLVYEIAKKKTWLREECGWVLVGSLPSLSKETNGIGYARILLEKLHTSALAKTPEGVAIWIAASRAFPEVQKPKGVWHHDDPLNRKESSKLALILKEASTTESSKDGKPKVAQKGTWTPKVHFAWSIVLSTLLETRVATAASHSKQLTFANLWANAVDSTSQRVALLV